MITLKLTDDELLALAVVVDRVSAEQASSALVDSEQYAAWQRSRAWVDRAATDLLNAQRGSRR